MGITFVGGAAEAGHCAGVIVLVIGHHTPCQIAGDGPARRFVGGLGPGLELGPDVFRQLGGQVAHAVRQAALTRRAWKAALERLDDAAANTLDQSQYQQVAAQIRRALGF